MKNTNMTETEQSPGGVAATLERIRRAEVEEELVFDPATGRLVVVPPGGEVPNPDALPATSMAREGFFAAELTLGTWLGQLIRRVAQPSAAQRVEQALERMQRGEETDEELVLDVNTGRLVVVRRGEASNPDALPAMSMAREGFFSGTGCDSALAVVHAEEVARWAQQAPIASPAVAVEVDGGEVLHLVLLPDGEWRMQGRQTPALAVRVSDEVDGPEALASLRPDVAARHVAALFQKDGQRHARVWSRTEDGWRERAVWVVPQARDAFARNRGILESSLLAGKRVAVVGLGSGGATIAVELAKAGVGGFVLADNDRVSVENVGRHVCDLRDIGRRKTAAVRERVRGKNPHAEIRTFEGDVTAGEDAFAALVRDCDVLIGATDNNQSRRVLNRIALETGRPAIFGRAFRRACGGDVIRVSPGGPCYECLVGAIPAEEETSGRSTEDAPAYADAPAPVEPGLSLDIAPIALMVARLAVQELVRGTGSTLERVDEDLRAPLYIWSNRREERFSDWRPLAFGVSGQTPFRWYGAKAVRRAGCAACDEEGFMAAMEEALSA